MDHRTTAMALSLWALPCALTAQLLVDPLPPMAVCGALPLSITFSSPEVFQPGNVFQVELSDASGSFAAPVVLGNVASAVPVPVSCELPAGITAGSGQAIRVVSTMPAVVGDAYSLPITTSVPPPPGENWALVLCSDAGPTDVSGGALPSGGMWSGPGPFNGLFDPMVHPAGVYTYTVPGQAPCTNAHSTVVITVVSAAHAGTGGTITLCEGGPPVLLFGELSGGPQLGGFWAGPDGTVHAGVFTPGTDAPGCYAYAVPGMAPCVNASAVLCVQVGPVPDAGEDAALSWCQSNGALDLFPQLGGAPLTGGTWSDMANTGQLTGSVFQVAGSAPGTYSFTYTVTLPGCAPDTAAVSVTVLNCVGVTLAVPHYDHPTE